MIPEKAKILFIDDDSTFLSAVTRLLTAAGFDIITSDSALRLPQLVQRERPDLVLLDVEMPALTGEHVLEMTKLFEFMREIPIVLYSAKDEELLQSLVERSDAVGYIKKSEDPATLVAQVQKFLEEAASERP